MIEIGDENMNTNTPTGIRIAGQVNVKQGSTSDLFWIIKVLCTTVGETSLISSISTLDLVRSKSIKRGAGSRVSLVFPSR